MNEFQLSKRLETVASFVPKKSRVADIGSDHAYLPIYLVNQGVIDFAVAGEVVKGPFENAKNQIIESGLTEKVIARMASGLNAIEQEDEIDVITICGMGGMLIANILEDGFQEGKLSGKERLILQPNVVEVEVRMWLKNHAYKIVAEEILEENEKIYEIIVAEKSSEEVELSIEEAIFGVELPKKNSAVFVKKWRQEQKHIDRIIENLQKAKKPNLSKITELEGMKKRIEEVLKHAGK
ncbi:tRNA (adenine22-N1)-methyltransferase [Pilibacter termitis]|uniref:tRNA (Adenine22-N1)-methyltransferase n=1 Tax=Pilibacter termitis TaxID=263852 RepID=A0A1T4NL65_9ENTE|nr:tRNA (adenine(22)-N(1))-methyltransferase TrmK [Pilibacter termitis]SJZ79932.1 tRNA (adenine22-N1)-methyltransferase [Pilibacter termitis]